MRQSIVLLLILMMTACAGYDKRTYTGLHTTEAESRLGTVIFVIPERLYQTRMAPDAA